MNKPVISLVGYARSGKGQVAGFLREMGFGYFSGGDYLRKLAHERGLSDERYSLIELGNRERAENGADYLMQEAMLLATKIEADQSKTGLVVDSLRNPGEVEFLIRELGALVINVWTPDEVRWKRIQENPKPGDPENWYEFVGLNAIDRGFGQQTTGQNIAKCVELAHITLYNDSSTRALEIDLDTVLAARGIFEGGHRVERF